MALTSQERQLVKKKGILGRYIAASWYLKGLAVAVPAAAAQAWATANTLQMIVLAAFYVMLAVSHARIAGSIAMFRTEIAFLESKLKNGP